MQERENRKIKEEEAGWFSSLLSMRALVNLSDACEAAESTLSTGINKPLGTQTQELNLGINFCSMRGRQGEVASGLSLLLAPLET